MTSRSTWSPAATSTVHVSASPPSTRTPSARPSTRRATSSPGHAVNAAARLAASPRALGRLRLGLRRRRRGRPVARRTPTATPETDGAHGEGDGRPRRRARDTHRRRRRTCPGSRSTAAGYTLVPLRPTLPSGDAVRFAFRVTGPDGKPVTDYTEAHEKDLHLIVVRRDLSRFQHVHPTLRRDGVWSVDLDLTRAGSYRAYADFVPAELGRNVVLGTDLDVAGDYRPVPLPAAGDVHLRSTATTCDGRPPGRRRGVRADLHGQPRRRAGRPTCSRTWARSATW